MSVLYAVSHPGVRSFFGFYLRFLHGPPWAPWAGFVAAGLLGTAGICGLARPRGLVKLLARSLLLPLLFLKFFKESDHFVAGVKLGGPLRWGSNSVGGAFG